MTLPKYVTQMRPGEECQIEPQLFSSAMIFAGQANWSVTVGTISYQPFAGWRTIRRVA